MSLGNSYGLSDSLTSGRLDSGRPNDNNTCQGTARRVGGTLDSFPTRLRYWRNRRNMSQRCLARHASISGSYVSLLEEGRSTPTIPIVERLAEALEVELGDLWPAARPFVLPDDAELLDLIERSGARELPEPHRHQLMQQLWESLELKRARAQGGEPIARREANGGHR